MSWLYAITIYPIELIYRYLYIASANLTGSYGAGLLLLSLCSFLIFIPLKRMAASAQRHEREIQDVLRPQIERISKESSGTERHERISRLYKRYAYHPVMAIRSAFGVFLQLPFLFAAYHMIGGLEVLQGQSFFFLSDLSKPDGLLYGINLLPLVMTLVNFATTCTSPDMRFKERLQAMVIALLFLVLLYNAPSALLLFWTCNNVLFLGESLWNRVGKKRFAYSKPPLLCSIQNTVSGFSTEILLSISFATTVCVFVPLDLYMSNVSEFWFPLHDIMGGIVVAFLALSLLVFAFLRILGDKWRTSVVTFLLALTAGFFLQSNFLNVYYGVLDGRAIPWSEYQTVSIVNTLVWGVLLLLPFVFLNFLKQRLFKRVVFHVASLILVVQALFLVYSIGSSPLPAKGNYYLSTEKMFELSSESNIIVFVLDTFDTELFQKLLAKYPEMAEQLDGFTYFPDTVGSYPTTKGALPQILTGVWYENREPYAEYIEKAWRNNPFWSSLKDDNYDARIYTMPNFVCRTSKAVDNLVTDQLQISSTADLLKNFYRLSAFRFVPHLSKKHFLSDLEDFYRYAKSDKKHSAYRFGDDVLFFNQLESNGIDVQNERNVLRFFHLFGAHPPYTMDQSVMRRKLGEIGEEDQAVGSLNIVFDFMKKVREKRLYNKSVFLIIADHGYNMPYRNPLLLVKHPNSLGKLCRSSIPMSFMDLHSLMRLPFNGEKSLDFFRESFLEKNGIQGRRFLFYKWNDSWRKNFLPKMIEYKVLGVATNQDSWCLTGSVYDIPGVVTPKYCFGEDIHFSPQGNGWFYSLEGLYGPWENSTWTEGEKGRFRIPLERQPQGDLVLSFDIKYIYKKQRLILVVGEEVLFDDVVDSKKLNIFIPVKYVAKDVLDFVLLYPNAVSPLSLGEGAEPRKLAFCFNSLSLHEKKTPCQLQNDSLPMLSTPKNLYMLGDILPFYCSLPERNAFFGGFGWSGQEKSHRWTEGSRAVMSFYVQNPNSGEDLLLRLKASAYLGGGIPHQTIGVFANDQQIATWQMKGLDWYEAIIPAEVLNETGLLNILFTISDPTAPSDIGESGDPRKLGIAARELVIEPYVPQNLYALGNVVSFDATGENAPFIVSGWSKQEKTHRWTEGPRAAMSFYAEDVNPGEDLLLRLKASVYLGGGFSHQTIGVFANEKQVATWQMKGLDWYEAVIPAEVLDKTKLLDIVFTISDPTAPSDVSDSKDPRKLGIAARELVIQAQEH